MNQETKICQNCKLNFNIEPEDFAFYEKIKVPAPTWCPKCRLIQRLIWRSESNIFKRRDDATGKDTISTVSPSAPVVVYNKKFWNSDEWNAIDYGRDYDFSIPFFVQLKQLLSEVPLPSAYINEPAINSEYTANITTPKDCYMVFSSTRSENCMYTVVGGVDARDTVDGHMITKTEKCYWDVNVSGSFNTHYSVDCDSCRDVFFSKDCVNCSDSFGCVSLRNKSYCFYNEQLSKDEYRQRLANIDLGSRETVASEFEKAKSFWLKFPVKYMHSLKILTAPE
ncbi:MAG: hypothetical protein WC764_00005, partial [Candidatus Paceibacterota bacterium]